MKAFLIITLLNITFFSHSQQIQLHIPGLSNIYQYGACVELLNPEDFVSWKWYKSYEFDGDEYYEIYDFEENTPLNCEAIYWNYAIEAVTITNDTLFHPYTYGYNHCFGLAGDANFEMIDASTCLVKIYAMGGAEGAPYTFYSPSYPIPSINNEFTISNPIIGTQYYYTIYDTITQCVASVNFVFKNCEGYTPQKTVTIMPPSNDGNCDGIISLSTETNDFVRFYLSQNEGYVLPKEANNLCAGVHELIIFEFGDENYNGCKAILPVLLPNPSDIFDNSNVDEALIVDTLFTFLQENCEIDFESVDSVYISSYSFFGNDSIQVVWNIVDNNGLNQVTINYPLPQESGFYVLNLQLYCPLKSSVEYVYALDAIGIGTALSTQQMTSDYYKIYPNPSIVNESFIIESPINGTVNMIDNQGKKLRSQDIIIGKNKFDTNGFKSGIYFIQIEGENNLKTQKIVIY